MNIRPPEFGDIDQLLELGASMHEESEYAFLPFDRDKVSRLIESYIQDSEYRFALVVERDRLMIGMIGGYLIDYSFCHEYVACDEVLFIEPRHRGSTVALRLIRAFRQWAIAHDASELCLGISTRVNIETTGRLYERLGFKQMGGIYKMRLPTKME